MAGSNVWIKSGQVMNLVVDATATGTSVARYKTSPYAAFQATVDGTGAVTAVIDIEVSLDGENWCDTVMGTITLSGTTTHTDGFTTMSPWKWVRANITTLTGTDATVNILLGV